MYYRSTLLFQQTTKPSDLAVATPRTAGWSEGWWTSLDPNSVFDGKSMIDALADTRAPLLGSQAAIVGCRIGVYEIVGNKLVPKGTSTKKFHKPGFPGTPCDVPQLAMMFAGTSQDTPNLSRFCIRGIPDGIATTGEFADSGGWKARAKKFTDQLALNAWGFIGRDTSQQLYPITKIETGLVEVPPISGVVNNVSYLRFHRVKDGIGDTVSGSFRVTDRVNAKYLLADMAPVVTGGPSGFVRNDLIRWCNFESVEIDCVTVRKVGNPFKGYRGRASKR